MQTKQAHKDIIHNHGMHMIAAIVAQQTPNDEWYVPVYFECTSFNLAEVTQPPRVLVSCLNTPIGIYTGPWVGVHVECQPFW